MNNDMKYFIEEDVRTVSRRMKTYLTLFDIREMQTKTMMRYHYIPIIRTDNIKLVRIPHVGEDAEKVNFLYITSRKVK